MKYSKNSVQYIYRPVLHQDIPKIPLVSDIDSYEYIWWKEQMRRCTKGYIAPDGKFINPIHYFYMNFITMMMFGHRSDSVAELVNPFYRDNDNDILDMFWNNLSHVRPDESLIDAWNLLFAKPRAIAYTYLVNYAVSMWIFIFRPDKPIVFAYEDETLRVKENKEFVECYKRLHPLFKRRKGENVVIVNANMELFSIALESEIKKLNAMTKKERAKDQEINYFNRALFILGTRDKGKLKGERVNFINIAEVGKWTKLKEFIDASEPTVTVGRDKHGMIAAGGTSDDIAPNNTDFEELFNDPKAFKFKVHKTYAYMVLKGFVDYETGKSDKVAAREYILAELKRREGQGKSYINFKAAFPLQDEDFFSPTVNFVFPREIIEEQEQYIKMNNLQQDWRRGRLIQEMDINGQPTGEVIFKEDEPNLVEDRKGHWWVNILKHPRSLHVDECIATIDDVLKEYGTQAEASSAESQNCMIVYSKPNAYTPLSDIPIAMYFGRYRDNNDTYKEFAKGMAFYNLQDASVLYEYHTPAFSKYLESIGMKSKLMHFNGQPGLKLLDSHKSLMVDLGNAYIEDGRLANWSNLTMTNSLKKWTLHKQRNDDIGSCLNMIFYMLDLIRYNTVKPIFNGVETRSLQAFQLNSQSESKIKLVKQNLRLGPKVHA